MVRLKSTEDLKASAGPERLTWVISSRNNPRDMAFISIIVGNGVSISEAVRLEQYVEHHSVLPKEYRSIVWQTLPVNHTANHEAIPNVIDMPIHRRK
jgi:hypothetical protein